MSEGFSSYGFGRGIFMLLFSLRRCQGSVWNQNEELKREKNTKKTLSFVFNNIKFYNFNYIKLNTKILI